MIHPSLATVRDYQHVYIAPHLDDAALSCGGRIRSQVEAGQRVIVVTICAGSPPADAALSPFAQYLHRAWALGDDPIRLRREEDERALAILGCDGVQLDQLDAPYRVAAYGVGDGWRGTVDRSDPLIAALDLILTHLHDQQPAAHFYGPLGVGNHVDHQIACAAGLQLAQRGATVLCYEDAPYAAKDPAAVNQRLAAVPAQFRSDPLVIEPFLERKLQAIDAYRSQLGELFGDTDWRELMTTYARSIGGGRAAERVWIRS